MFLLRNPQKLVGLETESPHWMIETVANCEFGIHRALRAIHWLKKEMLECQRLEVAWFGSTLREYQLEFISAFLGKRGAGLWAHTEPVESTWCWPGSIRFHC